MTTPTLVALDIGYGYVKALAGEQTVNFPSVIGIAENIRYTSNLLRHDATGNAGHIHLRLPEGERFIGDLALRQSRVHWSARDRRRTETNSTLTFALAALSELGIAGPVQLVTGLPVQWYQQDRETLRTQLLGQHHIDRAGRPTATVTIDDVLVTIQPFGTLFSVIFNQAGKITAPDVANGRVGIIDIGTYTTDFIVAEKGQYIEPASGSTTTALSRLYELTAAAIETRFDHKLDLHQTDRAIRAATLTIRGQPHKIADLVEPILQGIADDIRATLATTWADYESGLDTIFVSGGGAPLIGPYLTDRFPHLAILPSAALANVTGYHRYGLFKWPHLRQAPPPKPKAKRPKKSKPQLNGATA